MITKFMKFNFLNLRKNIIFPFSKFNFSSITLITREGKIDRSENPNFNVNINWALAKVWVNPHTNSYWNSVLPNKNYVNDAEENCRIIPVGPQIVQIDFDRFLRKVGLTISRAENVFIQDGLCKGKKVRIITNEKDDAADTDNLLEEKLEFIQPDVHVLYLNNLVEVGEKKFVFYDKKAKILISNSKNLDNIAKVVEKLE
jgi:hypothetical protein